MPKSLRRAAEGPRDPREAFQGRAGHRVHDPGRQAVHAPDAQRQAHRRRRAEVLHRHGEGEAHRLADRRSLRNPADQLDQLLAPIFDLAEVKKAKVIATGLPAGPGAASGKIYFNADRAVAAAEKGEKVLLVRIETSPGRSPRHDRRRRHPHRQAAASPRTPRSSPARWARSASAAPPRSQIDYDKKTVTVAGQTFNEGDFLSIDGTAGTVYARPDQDRSVRNHHRPRQRRQGRAEATEKFKSFHAAHEVVRAGHHASPSAPTPTTPSRPRNAVAFGATGIGLTRTEHMFFEGDRIDAMREMILADNARRPQKPRSRSSSPTSARTSSASSRRSRASRPRSASSIRRCTSSSRTTKEPQADLAKKLGIPVEKIAAARARAARVQPDARLPRLPPRHRVSRDHRDAGARRLRGRRRRARRRASR